MLYKTGRLMSQLILPYMMLHDMLQELRPGLEDSHSVVMQAEAVIAAAQQAATALVQQQDTVKPDVAVAILQRLGRLRTPEASAKLEVSNCPIHIPGHCSLRYRETAAWQCFMQPLTSDSPQ